MFEQMNRLRDPAALASLASASARPNPARPTPTRIFSRALCPPPTPEALLWQTGLRI